ncbi:hypothetical protein KK062_12180 [Fulvivirgaceae bacterium PWU5]|uniref:Uncharacterized protein n=1 Tax=Dawidia cretensis TaxID=2782350 RepID=A0AAP2GQ65_9BACT|nr:hypothetical protein [Dawidia cretensis]MBT1708989.1 hypothetical protein [Dawidia cretensis]
MKPAFLISFFMIVVSSMLFGFVYTTWTDFVQSNPAFFAIGLVAIITVGMCGMIISMMTGPALEAQQITRDR